jgi:N-acetylglucosaminyl-diphospho-decaprenol L-rhamnosyltransferase
MMIFETPRGLRRYHTAARSHHQEWNVSSGPITAAVVILNYRTGGLTVGALQSLAGEVAGREGRTVIVVDNASGDGSADVIEDAIAKNGWRDWARVIRSPENGGFSAGNNIGIRAIDADFYLLMNSDARLRPGALGRLLATMAAHPEAGLVGPRLEDEDGTPQESSFRNLTPVTEFMTAAATGPIDRLLARHRISLGLSDKLLEADWVSFACVMVRRAAIDAIGLMDEDYFLYFEDVDYCRLSRAAGWKVYTDPSARAVHLRGGTASLKTAIRERTRLPRYHYASRARYFAKFHGGRWGVVLANLMWSAGRAVSFAREAAGKRTRHVAAHQGWDNWSFLASPMTRYRPQTGEKP